MRARFLAAAGHFYLKFWSQSSPFFDFFKMNDNNGIILISMHGVNSHDKTQDHLEQTIAGKRFKSTFER